MLDIDIKVIILVFVITVMSIGLSAIMWVKRSHKKREHELKVALGLISPTGQHTAVSIYGQSQPLQQPPFFASPTVPGQCPAYTTQ